MRGSCHAPNEVEIEGQTHERGAEGVCRKFNSRVRKLHGVINSPL